LRIVIQMSIMTKCLRHVCTHFSWKHCTFKGINRNLKISASIWQLASYFQVYLCERENTGGIIHGGRFWSQGRAIIGDTCSSTSCYFLSICLKTCSCQFFRRKKKTFYAFCVSYTAKNKRQCGLKGLLGNPIIQQSSLECLYEQS
jgi:hypothetical protein